MGAVFREAGYELSAIPAYSHQNDFELVQSLVENRRADGIILTRIEPMDLRVRYLLEQGVPFVTHGRTELASPHAYVDFDNQQFTQIVTGRLVEQGCSKLMLIGPPEELTYANHMKLGFQKALAKAGLEAFETPIGLSLETPLKELRSSIIQLLKQDDRPDAIICGGELAALAVIGAVYDAGLTPLKDVAVTAKQTSSVLDHSYPAVDTCFEDIEVTGMLRLIAGENDINNLTTLIQPLPIWRN
jgi:LacI family transcriptional regulator